MYEGLDIYRRTIAGRGFRRALLRLMVQDALRALPDRVRSRRTPLVPLTPSRPLSTADVPLIVVTRDGAHLLPAFLRHYRALGVTRFIVLDDRSSDGSRDVLADHADVDLWGSKVRYAAARHGQFWRERLARIYGGERWYVNVDVDEFLVYDGMERHPLPELFRWLEGRHLRRLLAPMLDMYPPGVLSAAVLEPGQNPWDLATHFDASGYRIHAGKRTTQVFGGPRTRVFGVTAQMAKFPVLFWDRRTFFTRGPHAPFPYVRNFGPIAGALLHFKFFSDARDRVEAAVADGQYALDGSDYRAYHARLYATPDLTMSGNASRRYAGVADLVGLGAMTPIDWPSAAAPTAGAVSSEASPRLARIGPVRSAPKCFVVSLHRCGTRSTAKFLNELGIRTRHWAIEHDGVNLEEMVRGRETDLAYVADVLAPVIDSYQAVADVPVPALYRELFARYEDAKFLLVYRDPVDWVGSVRWKLRRGDFRPYVRTLYWKYFDWKPERIADLTDEQLIGMHDQHRSDVEAFFRDVAPDRLGVFDLYAPDTNERIAAFLGVESTLAFPHVLSARRFAEDTRPEEPA